MNCGINNIKWERKNNTGSAYKTLINGMWRCTGSVIKDFSRIV